MSGLVEEEKTEQDAAGSNKIEKAKDEAAETGLDDSNLNSSADSDEKPGDQLLPDDAFGTGGNLPSDSEKSKMERASKRTRVFEIGWPVDGGGPGFLWDSPRPLKSLARPPEHPKAVNHCPAIVDGDARTYSVAAPVDFHLRLGKDDKGNPKFTNAAGMKRTVSRSKLDPMIAVMAQNRWRHPKRPVLMIGGRFPIHNWLRSLMWAFE